MAGRGRPKGSKNKSKASVVDLNGKAESLAIRFTACEHGVNNAKILTLEILKKLRAMHDKLARTENEKLHQM